MRWIFCLSILFLAGSAFGQENLFPAAGNAGVGITNPPNNPLDAFHIHRPVGFPEDATGYPALRLTLGADRTKFGQLALQANLPAIRLSTLSSTFDLVLRTGGDNPWEGRGNILISAQQRGKAIGFAVTPTSAVAPFPKDRMAMEIASTGNVGIGLAPTLPVGMRNPLDLLHIQSPVNSRAALRLSHFSDGSTNFAQFAMEGNCIDQIFELSALADENCGDLVIRNVHTPGFNPPFEGITGDMIITSQKRAGSIRFGTSPEVGPLSNGFPDVERMVINDRGNVIIGASQSDRAEKLNVHFNLAPGAGQAAPFAALRLSQSDPDQGFSTDDMYRNGIVALAPFDDAWSNETKKNDMVVGTNSGDLILLNSTSGDEPTVTSGTQFNRIFPGAIRMMTRPSGLPGNPGHVERLTILSDGKVGIDDATPTHKLDVNGDLNFMGSLNIAHDPGIAGQILISNGTGVAPGWATPATSTLAWSIAGNTGINSSTDFLGTINNADLVFKTDNVERVRIKGSNGHVWIGDGIAGTGFPTDNSLPYKLVVDGTILAREIIVNNDWADFVFEPDYDLPTLEEVEAHIAEYGHLPEIPSAAEVQENGVALGEISAKLLQKIEELTLYSIEQKKEIERLKESMNDLQSK